MIRSSAEVDEQILDSTIKELKIKHRCHMVVLYGSRAGGACFLTEESISLF